jgi:sugar phosphate isomerase/epimerase
VNRKPAYRLGTTSYILPADIAPNVRFLSERVQDVELVLFEVEADGGNLPSEQDVDEMAMLAAAKDLTYTVHLPLDLRMAGRGEDLSRSLRQARLVIERTRRLAPWAYVLHLDGRDARDRRAWVEQACRSLDLAAGWAGDPLKLAVENLEGYPLDFIEPVLSRSPVSRCVDIGHLWLDGHDPLPYLTAALPRTRVIHLHGIGARDHQSLAHQPVSQVAAVLEHLWRQEYAGVLTLEVFGRDDFESSLAVLAAAEEALWPAD